MEKLFSTSDVRQTDRFDYWHELIKTTYAFCQETPSNRTDFAAQLKTLEFGKLEVSEVFSDSIHYQRTEKDIRKSPRDEVFLSLILKGTGHLSQNDRTGQQRCGDTLIYESGSPYIYSYDQPYHAALIRIPRTLAIARLPDTDQLGGLILAGDSPFGRLLASLIQETLALAATATPESAATFSPAMLDMMAATIRQAIHQALPDADKGREKLRQIQHYLKKNMADSTLCQTGIAKAQGLSLRSLSRRFAEAGTTPMAWLQKTRLQAAYAALAEHRVTSVSEAADAFGFTSLTHFGRSFRRAYGIAPGSLLGLKE